MIGGGGDMVSVPEFVPAGKSKVNQRPVTLTPPVRVPLFTSVTPFRTSVFVLEVFGRCTVARLPGGMVKEKVSNWLLLDRFHETGTAPCSVATMPCASNFRS